MIIPRRFLNRFSRTPKPPTAASPPPKAVFLSLSFHVLFRFSAAAQASLHRPAPRIRSRATLIPLLRPLDRRKGFENTHRQHHQRRESPNPAARVSRQVPHGNRSCASCACRIAKPEWGGWVGYTLQQAHPIIYSEIRMFISKTAISDFPFTHKSNFGTLSGMGEDLCPCCLIFEIL